MFLIVIISFSTQEMAQKYALEAGMKLHTDTTLQKAEIKRTQGKNRNNLIIEDSIEWEIRE